MNIQAAAAIAQGQGRVKTFLEQLQPGQGRPMPVVAGLPPREGNTPMSSLPMAAGAQPMMPQTVMPTMPPAQAAGASLMGLNQIQLRGISSWPTWLKVMLPITVLTAVSITGWAITRHYRNKRHGNDWPDVIDV